MHFPILKNDWQCNSWYHDTHAIASVHGTEDVFDSHYSPTKTSQALLWVEGNILCFLSSIRIYKHL